MTSPRYEFLHIKNITTMILNWDQVVFLECVIIHHPVYTVSETMLPAKVLKHGLGYILNMVWTALYFTRQFFVLLYIG